MKIQVFNNNITNQERSQRIVDDIMSNITGSVKDVADNLSLSQNYIYSLLITSSETNISPTEMVSNKANVSGGMKYIGNTIDVTDITTKITIKSCRDGTASTCNIDMILDPLQQAPFPEGSMILFKVNGKTEFIGYVFTVERDRWGHCTVIGYDSLRYLKSTIYMFKPENTPGRQIVEEAIQMCGLIPDVKVDADYKWRRMPFIQYNKTALDMVNWILSRSVATGKIEDAYCFRANYEVPGKTIEIKYCKENILDIVIGNKSLLLDLKVKSTIDENTYNKIQLLYDDGADLGRLKAISKNGLKSQREWGLLTLTKQMNGDFFKSLASDGWHSEPGQKSDAAVEDYIKEFAQRMLDFYNRPYYNLSMNCIGVPGVRGGDMIKIDIEGLGIGKVKGTWNNLAIIEQVTHTYEESKHLMDIDVRVGVAETAE